MNGMSSVALLLFAVLAGAQAPAAGKPDDKPQVTDAKDKWPSDFDRFVKVDDGGHFDTAITTYRNQDGVEVVLFGAVHVADAACYALLQERFAGCDALLYELVGPEDYRPRRGESGGSFVSLLQTALKSGLELEFQLDAIDYQAPNFVHADMTQEEFEESMAERGETLFGMLWNLGMKAQAQMLAEAAANDGEDLDDGQRAARARAAAAEMDLVKAFRSGEGRHRMRMMMAQQLTGFELVAAGGEGSTLLEGRNEKCLAVLQKQIAAGKQKLGIYYGAAHLPHMERRLCQDLGFQKVDHEWIVAWDCTKRPDPKFDRALFWQRQQCRKDLDGLRTAVQRWRRDHAGATPKPEDLRQLVDAAPYWAGTLVDPWGRPYAIDGYAAAPHFDVRSVGADGVDGSADDQHSASNRELRRMRRQAQEDSALQKVEQLRRDIRETDREEVAADAGVILAAAKLYRAEHGRWPTPAALLAADARGEPQLARWLQDPWGNDYVLREVAGTCQVRSSGPDGKVDTADDLVESSPPR